MAVDRSGLKFVGFIFATVTLAVMLTTAMMVKGYADGERDLRKLRNSRPAPEPRWPKTAVRQTGP